MLIYLVSIMCVTIFPQSVASQDAVQQWEKIIDGGLGHDYFQDVAIDSQGNVIAVGYQHAHSDPSVQQDNTYAVKYNSDGDIVWGPITFDAGPVAGSKVDSLDRFTGVAVDSEDNFIICGRRSGTWVGYYMGSYHCATWVQKYNSGGTLLWEDNNWQESAASAWQNPYDVCVDKDDDIYLANVSFHAWDNVTEGEWAVLKYDKDGTEPILGPLYYNVSPYHFLPDYCYDIAVDDDGNIIVVGMHGVYNDPPAIEGSIYNNYDWHVRKYNSSGTFLWPDTYGGTNKLYDYARSVAVDENGDIIVAGYTNVGTDNSTNANYDWLVIKYNASDGSRAWTYTYESAAGRSETAQCVKIVEGNTPLVGGSYVDSFGVAHWRIAVLDGENGVEDDEVIYEGNTYTDGISSMDVKDDLMVICGYGNNGTDNDMLVRAFSIPVSTLIDFDDGYTSWTWWTTDDETFNPVVGEYEQMTTSEWALSMESEDTEADDMVGPLPALAYGYWYSPREKAEDRIEYRPGKLYCAEWDIVSNQPVLSLQPGLRMRMMSGADSCGGDMVLQEFGGYKLGISTDPNDPTGVRHYWYPPQWLVNENVSLYPEQSGLYIVAEMFDNRALATGKYWIPQVEIFMIDPPTSGSETVFTAPPFDTAVGIWRDTTRMGGDDVVTSIDTNIGLTIDFPSTPTTNMRLCFWEFIDESKQIPLASNSLYRSTFTVTSSGDKPPVFRGRMLVRYLYLGTESVITPTVPWGGIFDYAIPGSTPREIVNYLPFAGESISGEDLIFSMDVYGPPSLVDPYDGSYTVSNIKIEKIPLPD